MDNRRAVLEPTLLFLVMFLPGYLGQARGLGGTVPDVTAAMVDAILLGVPQILLVLYLVALQPDPGWPQLGLVPLAARDIPAILVAAAGSVAIYAILALGASLLPRSGTLQGGLRWHLRSGLEIPLAIGGSLATGYREELFFRAYLLTRLAQAGVPTWAAAVSSTLLFALGHLYEGPLGIATALCLGAWFCFVFLRTRRLHVVAIAHGLWDAGALALTLIVPALPGGWVLRYSWDGMITPRPLVVAALLGAALAALGSCSPQRTASGPTSGPAPAPTAAPAPVAPAPDAAAAPAPVAPATATAASGLSQRLVQAGLSVPKSALASVDFELETLAGGTTKLSSLRGSVVMLNFWATWCPPCRSEMPSMQKLYERFKDKGLVVVAVDLQETKDQVAKYVADNHLTFPVLLDTSGQVGTTYGAQSIPTTWLVDRSGGIIARTIGSREWASPDMFSLFEALLQQ